MSSITQTIGSYTGGISQQPDELKIPGQVSDALNVLPDVTQGLLKRPGGKFVASLSDNGTAALLLVTLITLYFLLHIKLRYYLIPMGIVLMSAISIGSKMTHVKERVDIFLHPEN